MKEEKRTKELAFIIITYLVLLFLAVLSASVIPIVIFILPIVFTLLIARHDYKLSVLMALVGITYTLLFESIISVEIMIASIIAGGFIGYAIRRKLTPYETWARGTVGFSLAFLFLMFYDYLFYGRNWFDLIDTLQALWLAEFMQVEGIIFNLTEGGGFSSNEEFVQAITDQVKLLAGLIKESLPAIIIMLSMLLGFLTQWFSYKIINRFQIEKYLFPRFRSLHFPRAIIWLYLPIMIALLAGISPESSFYLIVVNASTIIGLFILIQGYSFIFFYANHRKVNIIVPILIVLFSFAIPIVLLFVRLIGIIDLGFLVKRRIAMGGFIKKDDSSDNK